MYDPKYVLIDDIPYDWTSVDYIVPFSVPDLILSERRSPDNTWKRKQFKRDPIPPSITEKKRKLLRAKRKKRK